MTDSPALPDPRLGSVIQDRYKILATIASGGMGVVYRGERLQLGRPVAIKFLHPWIASQRSFLERFEVEARAMSRLGHPNCVSVIDFGVAGLPFLVMDLVTGRSLQALIQSEHLEPNRVLGFSRQILAGVAHAHAQGIIHRDLKPANIIVSDAPGLVDHVRILDFGLAKLKGGPALTVGMAIGTPSYMAPEQTQEEGAIDARTDIYGIGILLFEMLTGRKPFVSDKVAELLLMHRSQPAPRLRTVASGASFSDALEGVVAKALAKAPADRFSSADEMAAALAQVPEAAAIRPSSAAPAAVPTAPAPGAADADKTIVDTSRQRGSALPPHRPRRAGARNWQRFLPPFSKSWSRRPWWVAGISAGLVLATVLLWVLLPRQPRADRAVTPPPIGVPPSSASDELLPMTPDSTPGLTDAAQLVRIGLYDQAITVLQEIRRDHPRSAYANFLLAVTYFEKLWWSVGLQHAQATIQIDPAYRRSPKLAKLLIHSLMSDSFWGRAAAFLKENMPEIAAPYLEEASQLDKSPRVRARAAQILASDFMRAAAGGTGQ